jgi:hypothetical protein
MERWSRDGQHHRTTRNEIATAIEAATKPPDLCRVRNIRAVTAADFSI